MNVNLKATFRYPWSDFSPQDVILPCRQAILLQNCRLNTTHAKILYRNAIDWMLNGFYRKVGLKVDNFHSQNWRNPTENSVRLTFPVSLFK